jgi:hypothetical protein
MVEGNHKTGMPALIRSVPNRDAHKRGTEPVFVVVVLLLNGTPPSSLLASIPKWSPLACLLKRWKDLDPINLKKKPLIFLCTEAWPQYPLGDQEK